VDLSRVTSYRELMGLYSTSIAKAPERPMEKVVEFMKKVTKGMKPGVSFCHEGEPVITLEYSLTEGKPALTCPAYTMSHLQFHYNTAYIFSGSKTSVLTDMISNANRALYKMGDNAPE